MYIYVYEAREGRRDALLEELKAAQLRPVVIQETFFSSDLTVLNSKGRDTHAILIGAGERGTEFVRAIRAQGCRNPVILLRDFKNARDTAQALDAGADEVMISPIKAVEVVSRINAVNRRTHGHAAESVTIGEVRAFFDGRDPEISGERLHLSRREHAIFQHLVLSANRVVSRAAIYDAIYGMDEDQPFDKVIDVYICKLRKKISGAAASGHQYIETIYGRGYKFSAGEGAKTPADSIAAQ